MYARISAACSRTWLRSSDVMIPVVDRMRVAAFMVHVLGLGLRIDRGLVGPLPVSAVVGNFNHSKAVTLVQSAAGTVSGHRMIHSFSVWRGGHHMQPASHRGQPKRTWPPFSESSKRRNGLFFLPRKCAQCHGLLPVMLTSGRYTAGRLILSGLYGLGSVCGGSHVAQVSMEQPVTRQRTMNRRRFMVVVSLY